MKATYSIQFARELTLMERESYWPDEDMAPDNMWDETEFDAEGNDQMSMMTDLFNLFLGFMKENDFSDVEILKIKEV